jgi:hypothetical protein
MDHFRADGARVHVAHIYADLHPRRAGRLDSRHPGTALSFGHYATRSPQSAPWSLSSHSVGTSLRANDYRDNADDFIPA